jgi:2-desacetyl-2-hydroxyethyl bacteriochlorophyllide A dehydrogenase
MRAAVFHPPRNFRIEDVPEPEITPDSVIIKVNTCGICGSDLHFYDRGRGDGAIMGHEFSGDVVAVGNNIKGVKKGDRATAMSGRGCGECRWCKQGNIVHCKKLILMGYGIPGAFAEYVAVPSFEIGRNAAILPDKLTYQDGATAEPLSVALYAADQTQPQPGDTVVVLGLGIIGLFLIQILKARGISRIITSGRRATRLQLAKECGADVVVDAAREDITGIVGNMTGGDGADIVFDCAGSPATFEQSLKMVHRGGRINVVGLYMQPVTWNPSAIVSGDITIIGCGLKWDLPGAVDLLKSGKVNTRGLVTHEFPLEKIKEAFATQMSNQDAIKVLVKP